MIEFHRLLLGDRPRNDAFEQALRQAIVPGKSIVADIGSGTGYLSFLASKMGAKECHLYEVDAGMLALSRELAKKNGIKNLHFHHAHSAGVRKPVLADVIVSETLGNYALEENILETLADARRFMKQGTVMIPQALRQYAAPVTSDRLYRELNVWDSLGFDFSQAKDACFHNIYVRTVKPDELADARELERIDFLTGADSVRDLDADWMAAANRTVYGFALWWECDLLPGLTISTSPRSPATHWEQIYLPVRDPIPVEKGETLRLHLRSDTRYEVKVHLQWDAAVGSKTYWKGDMAKGQL